MRVSARLHSGVETFPFVRALSALRYASNGGNGGVGGGGGGVGGRQMVWIE